MNKQHLISGIHHYCDRWCERCCFIGRCTLGKIEQKRWAKGAQWEPEDFFRELDKIYPEVEAQLESWLSEIQPDMVEFVPDDFPEPDLKRSNMEKELQKRGKRYARALFRFLKAHDAEFKARGIDLFGESVRYEGPDTYEKSALADALEVIFWHQQLMFAKAVRAFSGIDEMDEPYWPGEHQSDANGSAKIAIISAQQSLRAWAVLLQQWPEISPAIRQFIQQLQLFCKILEEHFPNWRKFVRPGFDTEPPAPLGFGEN